MAEKYLARVAGKTKQRELAVVSTGASDAGRGVALDSTGRLDSTVMPVGVGANTQSMPASEALGAGTFVNLWGDSGVLKARLADNSNGRQADGYVLEAVASAGTAAVYPLDAMNSALSGLTAGTDYWLGTAGGVIATPLVETDVANVNKISQYLGKAKSATELLTTDDSYVVL